MNRLPKYALLVLGTLVLFGAADAAITVTDVNVDANILSGYFGTSNGHALDGNHTVMFKFTAAQADGNNFRATMFYSATKGAATTTITDVNLTGILTGWPGSANSTYFKCDTNGSAGTGFTTPTTCTIDWNVGAVAADGNYFVDVNIYKATQDLNALGTMASTTGYMVDRNAPTIQAITLTTPANGAYVTAKTVKFDVNESGAGISKVNQVKVTVNGAASSVFPLTDKGYCTTTDDSNSGYSCTYTETAIRPGQNTILIDANDLAGNQAAKRTINFTYNSTAPIVYKNNIKVDKWLTTGALPAFGYFRDGNLTIDFNVFDLDVNGGIGRLDANIDVRRTDNNSITRIVTDLNLAQVNNVGIGTVSTYCDDSNFARGTGAGDWNLGSQCHYDLNISALWGIGTPFATPDKNWVIDINVTDLTNTDINTTDKNFEIDNTVPVIADINVTYSPGTNINDKNGYTNDATPTFIVAAVDANTMRFSCSGLAYSADIAYATTHSSFDLKDDTAGGCINADGNKVVFVRFKDTAGNTADYNVLGGTNDGNSGGIFIDTIKPYVRWDGNNSRWQKFDANVNLWCIDQNSDGNGSGCQRISWRRDTNAFANDQNTNMSGWATILNGTAGYPAFKSGHDARAFGDLNILFSSDGNYQVDFNAMDYAGNSGDINFFFAAVDKTIPVWQSDFNVDMNREWLGAGTAGILDMNGVVDYFIKSYQKFRVRITSMFDTNALTPAYTSLYSNKAPISDVNIIFTDLNHGTLGLLSGPGRNGIVSDQNTIDANAVGNGTWFYDFNSGRFDQNFVPKNIRVKVRDAAGNWSADTNITQFPLIFYNLSKVGVLGSAATGLDDVNAIDANHGSTNFFDLNNFADSNLTFTMNGKGQMKLYDVNISTPDKAAKLANLSSAVVMTKAASNGNGLTAGDVNIGINTSVFSDLNVAATLRVFGIPYATIPDLRKGDSNCGTYCTNKSYELTPAGTGILTFSVYGFSTYTTDKTQPVWANTTGALTAINAISHTLSGTTDENATCKYDTTNAAYASMANVFTPSNSGKTQTAALSFATGSTPWTYYVRCSDSLGNGMVDTNAISFTQQVQGGTTSTPPATTPAAPSAPSTPSAPTAPATPTAPAPVTETVTPATVIPEAATTAEAVQSALTDASALGVTAEQVIQNSQSAEITRELEVTKTTTQVTGGGSPTVAYQSTLTISFKNTTAGKLTNVKLLEVIPKSVAQTASLITVPAGVKYRIVKDDPIIEFIIDEVEAGQTAKVNYSVAKQLDQNTVGQMQKPLVLELTAPVEQPATTVEPAAPATTTKQATKATKPTTKAQPTNWGLVAIVIIIVVVLAYFISKPKKKGGVEIQKKK